MPCTVKVNGTFNSLVHKGSTGTAIATIPDVCKTPSPGGPVPIPYPDIAQSAMLAKGTTTVKADGMMAAVKGSEFSLSNGDNAGVAGGVKSSTFMKEATWILYSFDVKMDGKNACRFMDKMFMNHENTACLAGEIQSPVILMLDANLIGKDQDEACAKYHAKEVTDHDAACAKSGMRRDDYDTMRSYSQMKDSTISIRATNPASTKHIGEGVYECKPSSVQVGTIKNESSAFNGLTPPVGDPPKRYCGDYDMHDMIRNNGMGPGTNIPSGQQPGMIREMNSAMNPTMDPMRDRIKHGPASTLGEYLRDHPDAMKGEEGLRRQQYLNPMASKAEPLTVFDDGKVYQLDSPEDVINMYKCKGTDFPPQWNLKEVSPKDIK